MTGAVRLADQGYFWVGVTYQSRDGHSLVDGTQLYVEFQKPEEQTQPYPVVLVHGGGGQGLDWLGTPDGRPGWRTLLVQRGYPVYVVDRPGHGRSPERPGVDGPAGVVPSVETMGRMFAGAGRPAHTQWPGTGLADDPALAQLLASQSLMSGDMAAHHELMRRRGAELLDTIGPAVVIASSAGAPAGWLMADERPDLVRAVVALEPLGPGGPSSLPWGLSASPITYEPPAGPADLELVDVPGAEDEPAMRLQAEPVRTLPRLADIPIAIVSGEQSVAGAMDAGTVAFLRQAGCRQVDHLRLGELGIRGNGHLMMVELNNDQVLDAVLDWLDERLTLRCDS